MQDRSRQQWVRWQRREDARQTRAMSRSRRRGFKRSNLAVSVRAKTSHNRWLEAFKGVRGKLRWRYQKYTRRLRHNQRLQRDNRFAARCQKRRQAYLLGLQNDRARRNRLARLGAAA